MKNAAKPVVDEALVYYVSFNRTRDKTMITAEIGANVCMSVYKHSSLSPCTVDTSWHHLGHRHPGLVRAAFGYCMYVMYVYSSSP